MHACNNQGTILLFLLNNSCPFCHLTDVDGYKLQLPNQIVDKYLVLLRNHPMKSFIYRFDTGMDVMHLKISGDESPVPWMMEPFREIPTEPEEHT